MNLKQAYWQQGACKGQKPALNIQSDFFFVYVCLVFGFFFLFLGEDWAGEFLGILFELIKCTTSFDRSE